MKTVVFVIAVIFGVNFVSMYILTALFNIGYYKTLARLKSIHSDWWFKLRNPYEKAFGRNYRQKLLWFLLRAPSFEDDKIRNFGITVLRFINLYLINVTATLSLGGLALFWVWWLGWERFFVHNCSRGTVYEPVVDCFLCLFVMVWCYISFRFLRGLNRISKLFKSVRQKSLFL